MDFDSSLVVPTANENRPRSAVVLYCIKVLDFVNDPEQVLAQEAIADMAHRNEIKELAGTRLWVSGEYQPVLNTPTIVSHGLNIDPLRCRCDVLLMCKEADQGYLAGELAIGAMNFHTDALSSPLTPTLSANAIQINTGSVSNGIYCIRKTDGNFIVITKSKWRYVFRIWY